MNCRRLHRNPHYQFTKGHCFFPSDEYGCLNNPLFRHRSQSRWINRCCPASRSSVKYPVQSQSSQKYENRCLACLAADQRSPTAQRVRLHNFRVQNKVQSGSISAGLPIWLQASAFVAWRLYTVTGWLEHCSTECSDIFRYNCGPRSLALGSPFLGLCSPIHGCVKGSGRTVQ